MKVFIFGLVIAIVFSGSAWGGDPVLHKEHLKKALDRFDGLADMAMRGLGYGKAMSKDDCAAELEYRRHLYLKDLVQYDGYAENNRGNRKFPPVVPPLFVLPCYVEQ